MNAPYRPQRIKGKHALAAKMFQVIGGKRWSLVLMWDMEPAQAKAEAPKPAKASSSASPSVTGDTP